MDQAVQLALTLQGVEVVTSSHVMGLVDEDLGQGSRPVRALDHFLASLVVTVNLVFGIFDAFAVQQGLGPYTEGAGLPGVYFDAFLSHEFSLFPHAGTDAWEYNCRR